MSTTTPSGTAESIRPGDILAKRYRVDRLLGSGGTGIVVAATYLENGQRVAIKLLLPASMADAEVVGRFLREARASLSLQSEHVARVYEVGTLEGALRTHYMVMEYLEGTDLRALVRRGPLRAEEAVGYVVQACTAIEEAHQRGIVHRDIKPENLFVTRRADGSPLVKVLDFGISKMPLAGTEMQLTSSATVMGTPHYMAPEQMRSMKNVTARSDIWGMGTVLYELLSARRAFNGRGITDICTQVLMTSPPPLAEAPPELAGIVMRCLEKDPGKRFGSMAELAAALAPFAGAPFAGATRESALPGAMPQRMSMPGPGSQPPPAPILAAAVSRMGTPGPSPSGLAAGPLVPVAAGPRGSTALWIVVGVLAVLFTVLVLAVVVVLRHG